VCCICHGNIQNTNRDFVTSVPGSVHILIVVEPSPPYWTMPRLVMIFNIGGINTRITNGTHGCWRWDKYHNNACNVKPDFIDSRYEDMFFILLIYWIKLWNYTRISRWLADYLTMRYPHAINWKYETKIYPSPENLSYEGTEVTCNVHRSWLVIMFHVNTFIVTNSSTLEERYPRGAFLHVS
jgi:hypothetical protein